MARRDRPPPPDFDADLSAAREGVEYAGVARAIWEPRREPDAFARRCASDAIDAIDTALAALHRIRAEWITEIRQADDQAAARADALLAQMRDSPPVPSPPGGHRQEPHTTSPRSQAPAEAIVGRGGDSGPAPGEELPEAGP